MALQEYLGREFGGNTAGVDVPSGGEVAGSVPEARRDYYSIFSHVQSVYGDNFGRRAYIGNAEDGAALVTPVDMGERRLGDQTVRVFAQPTVRSDGLSTVYGLELAVPSRAAVPPYSAETCPALFRRLEIGGRIGQDGPTAADVAAALELAQLYDEVAAVAALEAQGG